MSAMTHKLIATLLLCVLCAGCAAAEVKPLPIDFNPGMPPIETCYKSETLYEDESIRVEIEDHLVGVTRCVVARVKITDPSQLRTAAAYSFDRAQNAKCVKIAERMKAVVAINGDYYCYGGKGFMIRQGQQYIDVPYESRDVLLIDDKGDFYIEKNATDEMLEPYRQMNIINSFNFGPGLVINGEAITGYDERFNAGNTAKQRSCIAQMKRGELEYLLVSCEGPMESFYGGLTIDDFAAFVKSLGAENAYNLDGGNSSALIFNGKKQNAVNNPDERKISDIIYFASAVVPQDQPVQEAAE